MRVSEGGEGIRERTRELSGGHHGCRVAKNLSWPLQVRNRGEKPLFIGIFFLKNGIHSEVGNGFAGCSLSFFFKKTM